jgi:hypothetical protein
LLRCTLVVNGPFSTDGHFRFHVGYWGMSGLAEERRSLRILTQFGSQPPLLLIIVSVWIGSYALTAPCLD